MEAEGAGFRLLCIAPMSLQNQYLEVALRFALMGIASIIMLKLNSQFFFVRLK